MLVRHPLASLAIAALVAGATLGATACSSGGDKSSDKESRKTTTSAEITAAVRLAPGPAVVQSAGPNTKLDPRVQAAVLGSSQRYIDTAVIAPIVEGQLGAAYTTLFDRAMKPYAVGVDRPALTDEHVPKATSDPTVTATRVSFDGLAGQDGALLLVATTFRVVVTGTTATGPVSLRRNVQLVFGPQANGSWLITGYRTTAVRNLPQGTTTTTAAKS